MSVAIIHDWKFKKDGNVEKGIVAAAELVDYFKKNEPYIKLSLWLRDQKEPLRFFHIMVTESQEAFKKICQTEAIMRFVEKLYPEIDQKSLTAPACDIVLCSGGTLQTIRLRKT